MFLRRGVTDFLSYSVSYRLMISWEEEEGAECYEVDIIQEGSPNHQSLTSKVVKSGVFEYAIDEDSQEFNGVDLSQYEVKVLMKQNFKVPI